MIFYFADRSMNILGCAGTEVDKNYHVIDDDKEEDVENGSAILQFTMIFKDNYEADARSLTNAGNYVLLKRNRKDECYTIIYSELDKSEHSIDVYAEDAGMELINQVAPKFNHYSAFDDALENKGLKDYVPGVAATADKWEVATYNTGEDSIIDVSALANKCYGQNGEEATATNWYIHIAYANKNQYGEVIDFSTTDSTNRKYFGNYKNTTAAGSTNPDDYSWSQAKGDVKDATTKIHIAYGDQDKHGNVYNFTTQYSLNNFRGYVGGALTAATTTQTSTETHSSDNKVLKVGDTVRIAAGARDMNYNCTFASWVYQRDYTVLEVRGNRIVFGWSNGAITGVTDAGHIIGGSTTTTTTTTTTVNTPAPTDSGSYGWTSVTNKGTSSAVGVTERFTCSTGEDIGSDKHALKTNYTNYLRTYYYFNQQTRVVTQYTSDDASSLYVNGELCVTNDGDINQTSGTGKTAYMYFNKGWNIVEIVLHQLTSPCWFKFSNNPRSDANCTAQNTTSDFLDAHSVEWYFNEFAGTSGFEIGTNELAGYSQRLYWDSEDTATSRLLSVANAFNGEMCYSFEIDHMQLHHMYVNFYKKRGTETDITLRFPKEVSNIRVKTSVENLATGLYATGDTIDDQNHELTLYGYSYDDGDVYVDSDGILKSRTALKTYHRYQVHNSTGEIIKTFSYQTKSQQELFRRAFNELSKVSKPEINYEVDIQIPSKDINIGDTIRVVDEKGGIYLRARVVKLERKIYTDELIITLGDYLIEESKISKDLKALAEQFRVYVATAKTYTWFVYADDPSGTNISLNPYDTTTEGDNTIYTFRKYVGIAYNMPSPSVNLSNPEIFQWSLIKGENGIPGQKGADGKTYYFHVAYANKADNGTIIDFSTTDPTDRYYIGTYTDAYEPDATVPTAYKWQLVKGRDADQQVTHFAYANREGGYFEIDDVTGNDDGTITFTDSNGHTFIDVSVSGSTLIFSKGGEKELYGKIDEESGTLILATPDTLYTDFSTMDNAGRKWLGVCVDTNTDAPTTPQSYVWTKVVGDDGTSYSVKVTNEGNGASITVTDSNGNVTSTAFVADGKDGQSIKGDDAYLHVAYAFSSDGKDGFSTTWVKGASYVGLLSNHTEADSTNYTDYEWSLIKGADGQDGKPGKDGTNGTSNYIHIKYSSVASPKDDQMTEAPDNYIGIAINTTETDPTTASSYTWSKFKGDDGIKGTPGKDGTNGKTYYVHFAYSTSSDGKENFSTTEFNGAKYMGVMTDENEIDSKVYTAYAWSLIKGADGHSPKVTAVKSGDITTIYVDDEEQATIKDGKDGLSGYTHIAYANVAFDPKYAVDDVSVDGNTLILSYTQNGKNIAVNVVGDTIKFTNDGSVPLQAELLDDGTLKFSYYTVNDFSTTDSTGRGWIGIYSDNNKTASTDPYKYKWSLIKGADGKGIKSTAIAYQASSSQTTVPSGTWANSVPSLSASNPFLWTRTVITYTDNTTSTSYSVSSAITDARINSTIIKHEQEYYQSTSDTALSGGSWSTTFPSRKDGTVYWVRYKDTHANGAVTYDPSANGKLLTEVNEVWNTVVSNKTAINSSNAQIDLVATSVTSVKNDLNKKANSDDVKSSMDGLSSTIADINKQVAELKVKANSIEASVTDVNNLAQTTKKATAALTTDGLSVDTGQTTKSVVDGTGLTITSKADNSVVAKFTTGESEIQNLKIDGYLKLGSHTIQKMQDTEWDGTTVNGTGWMWNGG